MYRKPKFLTILHAIREEMSREADYDVELFAELVRTGSGAKEDSNDRKGALLALEPDVKQSYRNLPDNLSNRRAIK
ncbi:MAG: hypothetical protein ACRD63_15515 [Pyrinomonadaceae bacterium]